MIPEIFKYYILKTSDGTYLEGMYTGCSSLDEAEEMMCYDFLIDPDGRPVTFFEDEILGNADEVSWVRKHNKIKEIKNELNHIQKPYSLKEILDLYCKGDYNAELLLQHALLHLIK